MSYTPVKTVTDGMAWTAKDCNIYFRDNFAAGVPDIFTTKGDLAVASDSDAAGRLGIGTNGKILTADSVESLGAKWALDAVVDAAAAKGDLILGTAADAVAKHAVGTNTHNLYADSQHTNGVRWATQNRVRSTAYSATQNIAASTWTKLLLWATDTFDTASCFASYTMTPTHSGLYLIGCSLRWEDLSGGAEDDKLIVALYLAGSLYSVISAKINQRASNADRPITGLDLVQVDYGQTLDIYGYHTFTAAKAELPSATPNLHNLIAIEIGG